MSDKIREAAEAYSQLSPRHFEHGAAYALTALQSPECLEAAAKVLCNSMYGGNDSYDRLREETKERWRDTTSATIKAACDMLTGGKA